MAYELETHGYMTNSSFERSLIRGTDIQDRYGISDAPYSFGDDPVFIELVGEYAIPRSISESASPREYKFEQLIMIEGLNVDSMYSLAGWLMRGAIREDDYRGGGPCDLDPPNPVYESTIDRSLNHFYDPYYSRGLVPFFSKDAVTWSLGATDAFADPDIPDAARENHFTWYDAQEAMYRALTGHTRTGDYVARDGVSLDRYWATTFKSLGHVMHLLEDMAQPQHTRNDQHVGKCHELVNAFIAGKSSSYEKSTKNAVLGSVKDDNPAIANPPYTPVFTRYTHYFSTAQGNAVDMGMGMADYSHRGFFSPRTLPGSFRSFLGSYPLPSSDTVNSELYRSKEHLDEFANVHRYLVGDVHDRYNGTTAADVHLLKESVWKFALDSLSIQVATYRYSLDDRTNNDAANLLMPRAVGYATGLLNHFFRGKLELVLPDDGFFSILDHAVAHGDASGTGVVTGQGGGVFGFTHMRAKVKNVTPDIETPQVSGSTATYSQALGAGTLRAVARYRLNPCYKRDLSETQSCSKEGIPTQPWEIAASEPIAVTNELAGGDFVEFDFDFSMRPIPINAADLTLRVVYDGQVGAERALAVGYRDIAEPSYFALLNLTTYFDLYGNLYSTAEIDASPELRAMLDTNGDGEPDIPYAPRELVAGPIRIANRTVTQGGEVLPMPSQPPFTNNHLRLAILQDYGPLQVDNGASVINVNGRRVQALSDGSDYVFSPFGRKGDYIYQSVVWMVFGYPTQTVASWAAFPNVLPTYPPPTPVQQLCYPNPC